jgi:DNA polymerase III subunit alpha
MPADRSFAHLHNHTEYSMLDGYQQHDELAACVADLGQPAVAMTDHGNLFGAFSFYQAMTKAGIKPVIGIESYVAPSSRYSRKQEFWDPRGKRSKTDRDTDEGGSKDIAGGGRFTHLTLLAKNATGLRMLYELAGRASMEGQYPAGKGRMDRELFNDVIGRYGRHLIASTGCPSSEIQTRLRLGQHQQAREAAGFYRDLFGPENYFMEVMDHGLSFEKHTRAALLAIGKELGIRPLATNDAHYVYAGQAHGHDCLLCIGTGNSLADSDRLKFDGGGYYVKSAAEMRALFDAEVPGACDNTLLVADMVESYEQNFAFRNRMPHPPVPDGFTEEGYLRHLVDVGLQKRYGPVVPAEARERAEYELGIILPLGFAGYFIMVYLLCGFMRTEGIRFGPRGSAAGSIVVYALEIADMDPLRHKLMFERFMNPERISPPDIDLDIDERRREEVVAYVVRTYGEAYVSQIITFGRMKTRESIDDSARIKQLPIAAATRLKKTIPPDSAGFGVTFDEMFDQSHRRYDEGRAFRDLVAADPEAGEILTTARLVEGRVRKTGKHACGLIVSSEPLLGQVPVWLDIPKEADRKKGKADALLAGHEYPDLESMGLQKMDLLGLRNWTVIDDTIKMVERDHGRHIDIEDLGDFDDPEVYAMLARGETAGVFQLEGSGMQSLLRTMKPTAFEDIMAVGALYRPGPMGMKSHENYALRKNGRQDITAIHPQLEKPLREVLAPTYGVICYQEQVIDAAMIVAGYTRGQADLLRKVMGKKKKDLLAKEYEPFSAAMLANGFCQDAVDALWNTLVPFAEYAFNRAHTACYGRLAYVTAWLKLHYPAEYLAALLTSVSAKDKDKAALYLAECRRLGIRVLPPDVNESQAEMSVVDGQIRYGLAAIRDVGSGVVAAVLHGRASVPYESFLDFIARVAAAGCTKKAVLGLIEAGAFDSLGARRSSLAAIHEQSVEAAAKDKKAEAGGAVTLFSGFDDCPTGLELAGVRVPDCAEWPKKEMLAFERARLGLYVSGHPLDGAGEVLAANRASTLLEIREREVYEGAVNVAGVVSNLACRIAKSGMMATFDVEDLDTAVRCTVFPRAYQALGSELADDRIVSLKGRLSEYDGDANIVVDQMLVLNPQRDRSSAREGVVLRMPAHTVTPERVRDLGAAFDRFHGDRQVFLDLLLDDGSVRPLVLSGIGVAPSRAFYIDMEALLGRDAVVATTAVA